MVGIKNVAESDTEYTIKYDPIIPTLNGQNEGIAVLDAQGTIRYLNAAWKRLMGIRDAESLRLGNNFLEVLNGLFDPHNCTNLSALEQSVQRLLRGECEYIELEYPHSRGGRWQWFLIRMSRYPLGSEPGILVEQCKSDSILNVRAVGKG